MLAAAAAFVVTLIQLAVIRHLRQRSSCEPLALAAGALAFAALGTALGALAPRGAGRPRCWRSCSRCRSRSSPWCPPARSTPGLYDALNVVSGAFPFKPTLRRARRRRRSRCSCTCSRWRPSTAAIAASLSAGSKLARRWPFPPPACAACAQTGVLRGLVRETELAVSHLVYPMFVVATGPKRTPIAEMPGIDHVSIDGAVEEAGIAHALGIPAVLLFGLPAPRTRRARARGTTRA